MSLGCRFVIAFLIAQFLLSTTPVPGRNVLGVDMLGKVMTSSAACGLGPVEFQHSTHTEREECTCAQRRCAAQCRMQQNQHPIRVPTTGIFFFCSFVEGPGGGGQEKVKTP